MISKLYKSLRNTQKLGALIIFFISLFYFPITLWILGEPNGLEMLAIMGLTIVNIIVFIPLMVLGARPETGRKVGCGLISLFFILLIAGNGIYIDQITKAFGGTAGNAPSASDAGSIVSVFASGDTGLMIGSIGVVILGAVVFVLLAFFVPSINKAIFPHKRKKL